MLNLSTDNFLTLDEVKQRAKSIFTETAAPTVSDKFTHIPTFKVIEDMEQLGWGVVDAKQVKARKGQGFQKHLVVFRNPDVVINGADGVKCKKENCVSCCKHSSIKEAVSFFDAI